VAAYGSACLIKAELYENTQQQQHCWQQQGPYEELVSPNAKLLQEARQQHEQQQQQQRIARF
jgi:hypothetical protein